MSSKEVTMKYIKCIVVGGNGVGKTSLLLTYKLKRFPTIDDHVTIICSRARFAYVVVESSSLDLWDTMAYDDYTKLGQLGYWDWDVFTGHVFLVCFSVVMPSSVESLKTQWLPEIIFHCPDRPYILVGTQIDLRDDGITVEKLAQSNQQPIDFEEGLKLAEELKAVKYLECSALIQEGMEVLVEEVVLTAVEARKKEKKRKCLIL